MIATKLIELGEHYACWKGRLIAPAFADLQRGIERERARLAGKRFVVVSHRRELEFDGLTEHVALLAGFTEQERARALALVDEEVQQERGDALGGSVSGWRLIDDSGVAKLDRERDVGAEVQRIHIAGFKVGDNSGYNSLDVHVEAVEVVSDPVVGEPLFRYLDCEPELIAYFVERGREP